MDVRKAATLTAEFSATASTSVCGCVGMGCAMGVCMLMTILFMSCTSPSTPLPNLKIPDDTLVMRESFRGPGPERTGNWWGRFDSRGCWWEAHNTWLTVSDPVLLRSAAHPLHWNAVSPARPWFCLTAAQRDELRALVDAVSSSGGDDDYQGPTDRWLVVDGENVHTWTGEGSADSPSWQALIEHFEVLSSVHVWGQSPEDDAHELDTPRVVSLTVGGSA